MEYWLDHAIIERYYTVCEGTLSRNVHPEDSALGGFINLSILQAGYIDSSVYNAYQEHIF